jgi:hypothetical protein
MGDYKGQLTWSNTALETFGSAFGGYCELQAGYCASFAYAMMNNPSPAVETICRIRGRIPDAIPPWLKQASLLFEADIWQLTGQTTTALSRAREALDFSLLAPYSAAFVGLFTRWLALASESQIERRKAATWLSSALANLERYDAMDQVEVLSAFIHLDLAAQLGDVDVTRMLKDRLGVLPYSINEQLKKFGLLQS